MAFGTGGSRWAEECGMPTHIDGPHPVYWGEPNESDATFKLTNRAAVRIALVACVAIVVFWAWRLGLFDLTTRERVNDAIVRVQSVRFLVPVFVCVYALTSAIGVPASALTLAGGVLFGVTRGIALNWLGEMAGALLAFLVTRALSGPAIDWVRMRLGDRLA